MKNLPNILIAGALFIASFWATRSFLAGPDPIVMNNPGANQPGGDSRQISGGHQRSMIGVTGSSQDLFARWKFATEQGDRPAWAAVIQEWAHTAPEAGIETALAEGETYLAWQIAKTWAEYDGRAAVAAAKNMPLRSTTDAGNRRAVMNAAVKQCYRDSPEELTALLTEIPDSRSRLGAIEEDDLGDIDPVRQAAALEPLSDRSTKTRLATPVLAKWARTDPEAALQWLEEHLPDPDGSLFANLLGGWAANDPRAAALRIPETGGFYRRAEAIERFLTGAFEKDPDFAAAWAKENFDEATREALSDLRFDIDLGDLAELVSPAATATDPSAKLSWPPQTEDQVRIWAQRRFNTRGASSPRTWKVEEIQAATAILIEKPELAKTPDWHRQLSEQWARENPQAALEWSASLPPELQIEAAESALAAWFQLDPKQAVAFTESLPDSEFRGYAIEKIANDWASTDSEAAFQWAASLPSGAARDAASERIASQLRFRQPDRAIEAARMIEDDTFRLESLTTIIDFMGRRDLAKAEAFVRQGDFSESERKALLDRLSRP